MSCPFAHKEGATEGLESRLNGSAQEQLEACLQRGITTSTCRDEKGFLWPNMLDVTSHVYSSDYESILSHKGDTKEAKKVLCSNGFIGSIRIEWADDSKYSGLFGGKSIEYGIIRLSSALYVDRTQLPWYARALTSAELFPCVAMKFFRDDAHSGNLLFGGKKTGQDSNLFFKNAVCTHLTEKVPLLLSWIQSLFSRYSEFPVQLGLSDFAAIRQDGSYVSLQDINFPWCITLVPYRGEECIESDERTEYPLKLQELQFSELGSIPQGATLYELYALDSPNAALDAYNTQNKNALTYLGKVVTTSSLHPSDAATNLFFKHQRKEEDYEIKPAWRNLARSDRDGDNVLGCIGASFIENLLTSG